MRRSLPMEESVTTAINQLAPGILPGVAYKETSAASFNGD